MTIYTVAEIRKNMRVALDMAETTPIFIKRHDKIFMLRLTPYKEVPVVEFDPKATWLETDEVSSNVRPNIQKIKKSSVATPQIESKIQEFQKEKKMKFCANGHAIPDGRSKCMGKGCKYA